MTMMLTLASAVLIGPGAPLPSFDAYATDVVDPPSTIEVDLTSHPSASRFRTRLSEAFAGPVEYAGRFRVAVIGCGTSCASIWVLDGMDGSVHLVPTTASYGVEYHASSSLIVINPPSEIDSAYDDERPDWLHSYAFVWVEATDSFELIWTDDPEPSP